MGYKKKGVILVEVMVAIIIFTIVMLGGLVFFFYGRSHISLSNHQRMALELTKERIELWKADDYDNITTQIHPAIYLGGIQFNPETELMNNGTYESDGYKEVKITTSWQEGANPYSVQLVTIIAHIEK